MHFYVLKYVRKIMSVRWSPSCRTHIRCLSSKPYIARSNISCGWAAISWRMESFSSSSAPWLLKMYCMSCPPAHAQRHQPHPCRVLAIWITCVYSAPPCIRLLVGEAERYVPCSCLSPTEPTPYKNLPRISPSRETESVSSLPQYGYLILLIRHS
jgi:hypothetical protein